MNMGKKFGIAGIVAAALAAGSSQLNLGNKADITNKHDYTEYSDIEMDGRGWSVARRFMQPGTKPTSMAIYNSLDDGMAEYFFDQEADGVLDYAEFTREKMFPSLGLVGNPVTLHVYRPSDDGFSSFQERYSRLYRKAETK